MVTVTLGLTVHEDTNDDNDELPSNADMNQDEGHFMNETPGISYNLVDTGGNEDLFYR